jgi:hypothetical protein
MATVESQRKWRAKKRAIAAANKADLGKHDGVKPHEAAEGKKFTDAMFPPKAKGTPGKRPIEAEGNSVWDSLSRGIPSRKDWIPAPKRQFTDE